jgi:hypothetical protein
MNAETLLSIAKYAGLGGLGLVAFGLVARTALKNLPRPEAVLSEHFFRTVDRIILFAFILSLVGLVTYAVLEFRRTARLQNEYDQIKLELTQIQDPNLKRRGAAIEVLTCDVTFDFRNWSIVPEQDRLTTRRSYELLTTKRQIWRAHPETRQFSATFGTDSPFEPLFDSADLSNEQRNPDQEQNNKTHLQRWILDYDISRVPLFTPYDIITQIKAWNCWQDRGQEGTLIMYPTRSATLTVLFPHDHRPDPSSFHCFDFPLDKSRAPKLIDDAILTVAPDRSWVKWEVKQPRLNYHYVIEWKW